MKAIIPNANIDSLESGGGSGDPNRHDSTSPLRQHRQYYNLDVSGVSVKIIVMFVMIGISCVFLSKSSYYSQFYNQISSSSPMRNHTIELEKSCGGIKSDEHNHLSTYVNEEMKELKDTLKRAAMSDNKTVIITALNAAWTEPGSIFDLFLESFRIGYQTQNLLNHVVVAALDEIAYSRCQAVNLHCFALTTAGVNFSGEAVFMSQDYLSMMWRRIDFLRVVLELGYDFVFSDADVMWFRDPFTRFDRNADFQIACDHYWFNSTDLGNSPNGGFYYVKSSNRTVSFYKFWYNGKDYFPQKHDQDVLNMIKSDPYVRDLELDMRFLDTAYFGGFCEPKGDMDGVITMHANCCIGLENKIHDIKVVIEDWNRYIEKNNSSRSWTVPRRCF